MSEQQRQRQAPKRTTRRTARSIVVVALALMLNGCAPSVYDELRSESDLPQLTKLVDTWGQRSNHTYRVKTRIGDGPIVHVALHELGNRAADNTLVFIHGVNADHSTWRFVVAALGLQHHLILVDLPGCGDSDKPHPDQLGPTGYSPDDLAERVLQALSTHLGNSESQRRTTIVAHSLGGRIAIRMMSNPTLRSRYATMVDTVERMVLLSPADVAVVNPAQTLQQIIETPTTTF